MKNVLFIIGIICLVSAGITADSIPPDTIPPENIIITEVVGELNETKSQTKFVIYYLHMNRRCMTCEKLEAYSSEAIKAGFESQLIDSSLIWKILNFEEESNEHFAKDYQLYSQSLIISKTENGKETSWKNLDQIWKLVHNKDEFITYVQTEIKSFINQVEEK